MTTPAPAAPAADAEPMTVEQIAEAIQAIIDAAVAAMPEGAQGDPELSADQVRSIERLERRLAARRTSDTVLQRARQYAQPDRAGQIPIGAGVPRKANGKPEDTIERAFDHFMRTGKVNQDIAQLRAQSEGVGSQGGFLVPDTFRDRMVDRMKQFGGIEAVAEEVTTSTGAPLSWPTSDDTANLGEIVSEGGTFSTGADLVFGTADLGAYRYAAGGGASTPLRVPVELAQDAAYDLEGFITRKLGERIGRIRAVHHVRGTGVKEPLGITTGLTGVEGAAAGTTPTYADILTWIHSVDPAYRADGCRWAFNDQSLRMIKSMVDSHGDPLWRRSTDGMGDGTENGYLEGYPITIDQAFPDRDADNDAVNWGVFGNIKEGYVVRKVREVVLVVNPWTRANNGEIEYSAWSRSDATQQNTAAYVALTGFVA